MPMPVVVLPFDPLLFAIVPPVLFPPTDVSDPSPTTVNPPVAPVLLRIMPLPVAAPELMLWKVTPLAPIVVLVSCSAMPAVALSVLIVVLLSCVALTVPPVVAAGPGPTSLKAVPLAVATPMLLRLKVLPVLVPVKLIPLAAPVPVTVRSRIVALVVMLFPRIPLPAVGLIERSSTRLLPPSVTIVALLLSTGVVLAGKVRVWLLGASVMPASVSAWPMLIA